MTRKLLSRMCLAGAITMMAFAGGGIPGQEPKKAAPARPVEKVVGKAIAPIADGDAVVQQWEQQFLPQFRQVYRGELHFLRLVTGLTKAQYDKIAADGDSAVRLAVRKYAQSMRGGGEQSDPTTTITDAIAKSVAIHLSAEQSERYRKELDLRTAARKRLVIKNLVALIDQVVILRIDQRDKLADILTRNWNESWNQTQILMYGGRFFPPMPDAEIEPILSEAQRTVWRGINKNQVRFGVNFGFWRGIEFEDETWDADPPAEKPAKPDDKPAPKKDGPEPKAAKKP